MDERLLITGISNICFVDKEKDRERFISLSKTLTNNELIYHFSGESTVYFDDEVLGVSPGSVRFIPAGSFSRYDAVHHITGESIVVYFTADRPLAGTAFVRPFGGRDNVGMLFKQMLSTWTAKDEGYYFECVSKLYKILSELIKHNYVPKNRYERIKPAVDAINLGFPKRSFTTRELADIAGISEAYLKRLFNERFGMPPKKYMIRMRINHAADLLRIGRYTVTEVSQMSGYSDVYFFSRQFKAYIGIPPSEFREKLGDITV